MSEPAGPQIPVLDIGGVVGALVVHLTSDGRHPAELEACPVLRPEDRFHTGIHRRPGTDTAVAVFPEVLAGTYHLLDEVNNAELDISWSPAPIGTAVRGTRLVP